MCTLISLNICINLWLCHKIPSDSALYSTCSMQIMHCWLNLSISLYLILILDEIADPENKTCEIERQQELEVCEQEIIII